MPFATAWLAASAFASVPTAVYGVVLLCAALAYSILVRVILALEGPGSPIALAVGGDRKGNVSALLYVVAVAIALLNRWAADAIYVAVALLWLVPDRRMEHQVALQGEHHAEHSAPHHVAPHGDL